MSNIYIYIPTWFYLKPMGILGQHHLPQPRFSVMDVSLFELWALGNTPRYIPDL